MGKRRNVAGGAYLYQMDGRVWGSSSHPHAHPKVSIS